MEIRPGRRQPLPALSTLLVAMLLALTLLPAMADTPRTIDWDDLMPEGWEPKPIDYSSFFHDRFGPAAGQQDDDAPVVEALDAEMVQLDGWLVPLEWDMDAIREFLFVPWFGACIHVPPPPSNQIIRLTLAEGVPEKTMFEPQTLTGRLQIERSSSDLAMASYRMLDGRVEPADLDEDDWW